MKLAELINVLEAAADKLGDVPVMLSIETAGEDGEDLLVHGDLIRAGIEQSHGSEEWFIRITGYLGRPEQ